jgi:pyrroloquinoline quinone biosynthesis protein B
LVNASPDLRAQIETHRDLQPLPETPRNTPITGVLLTNADLDHVLGLFLLREGGPLNVYASAAVRTTLDQVLGLSSILQQFCGIKWHEPPTEFAPLSASSGSSQNLLYRAIPLPARPPVFAKDTGQKNQSLLASTATTNLAYQFLNSQTKRRLLVAPDVGEITDELASSMQKSDAVLIDGTFWSGDELTQVRQGARTAQDMGHVTIRDSSLKLMAGLAARHKVYIHINNTNPMLAPDSPERKAVEAAGIVVGYDGLEFEL